MDPAFARSQNNIWACNHIYDGLVQLDDSLKVTPSIAKSWEISDDSKTYRFFLRNDVLFHANPCFKSDIERKVNAYDVLYSFERIISDTVNSPGSWIFKGKVDTKKPFVAVNDTLFEINLSKAFVPFLGILTMEYCSIIPEEAVKHYGPDFRKNPVGAGPFKFKRWLESQGLFLLRNSEYYGDTSLLDGVRTSFITDRKIAFLELMKGNIDFSSGLESSFVNDLLDKNGELLEKQKEKLQFIKAPYLNMEYLGINMSTTAGSPLANKKVRQALNFAIDRRLMLKSLRNNVGYPAISGFVPRGLPSYDEDKVAGYQYNPKKAMVLLKEAGFEAKTIEIELFTNKDYLDVTTFVARQWEEIGITCRIVLMESALLRDGMRNARIPLFRASWIADYPDGENFLSMFYSKNPAPPNYTRYSNPNFDELYELSLEEKDDSTRYTLYQEMDRILIEDAPVVFLFYDETALFATRNIRGISDNGINMLKTKQLIKSVD